MQLSKVFKRNKRRKYYSLTGYIFIMPWLLGFLVFGIIPMVSSLYLSFTRYDLMSSPIWTGLGNYSDILHDGAFWQTIRITFSYVFIAVPLRLIFALFLAILLSQKRMMVGLYRALFYIPSLVGGSVAIAVMWRQLFGVEGALNSILMHLGVIDKNFGSPMLIFIAGLKQIPDSYYEAASIDGAHWWQMFVRITIPMLSPIIFFNLIMQTIGSFMMFTSAYIVTGGGPYEQTMVYSLYLFKNAFTYYKMGYASALSWILLFILAIVTFILFKTSPRWVYYESKSEI